MGIYLNPGNKGFWESIRSKIYVDKTGLIACTNELIHTEEKYICVSRPGRFGKSMALKMLAAYYGGCGYCFFPLPSVGKPALVVELKYDKKVSIIAA